MVFAFQTNPLTLACKDKFFFHNQNSDIKLIKIKMQIIINLAIAVVGFI